MSGDEISPRLFMGFGYNPDLAGSGERLDILEFYTWMKNLQDEFSTGWYIFDASGYQIVNRTPKKKIEKLGDRPGAEQVLDVLVTEQDRPKRSEIMRNCDLRSRYLRKAIDLSGINAEYIDSREVFREDSRYRDSLDESLDFVRKLERDAPDLVENIMPGGSNPASALYLPLEIAEALYLEKSSDVTGKFGPETEKYFDKAIMALAGERGSAYQTLRCPSGPRKPGYLSERDVIWTSSPEYVVSDLLGSDKDYKEFVSEYLEPFRREGESIEQTALQTKQRLKLDEVK